MPNFRDPHYTSILNVLSPTSESWKQLSLLGFTVIGLSPLACSFEPKTSSDLVSSQLRPSSYERTSELTKVSPHQPSKIQSSKITPLLSSSSKTTLTPALINVDVERLLVAREVKKRRAIGENTHFPSDIGAIWSFAQVYAQGGTAELEIRWWYNTTKVSVNPFLVAEGLRWREWSKVTIKPSEIGQWKVDVFDRRLQKVLSSHRFIIDPPTQSKVPNDKVIHSRYKTSSVHTSDSEKTARSTKNPKSLDVSEMDQSFVVSRFEIARTIKRRRPLGTGSRFSLTDERLWGYIEVSNSEGPKSVWMEWYRGEDLRSRLKVRVGVSKRWRTWSWQRLNQRDQGQWSVRVLSDTGHLLAQTHFTVGQ